MKYIPIFFYEVLIGIFGEDSFIVNAINWILYAIPIIVVVAIIVNAIIEVIKQKN